MAHTLASIRTALETAGVEFTDGDALGVRLRLCSAQVVSPDQCRQARALLGWTRVKLGAEGGVGDHVIAAFEKTGRAYPPGVLAAKSRPPRRHPRSPRSRGGRVFHQRRPTCSSPKESHAVTPADFRQARRLLGWTIAEVAAASNTNYQAVDSYERSFSTIEPLSPPSRTAQLARIRAALETAGIEFPRWDGQGVRLRPKAFGGPGVTPAQCEGARRLLGWSRERLGAF